MWDILESHAKSMKHFFVTSALFFTVLFSTVQTTHAQYVVFDPTAEITRYAQLAEALISSASDMAMEFYASTSFLNETVLDPLANALIALAQIQQQTNTINLITGSLGGNSLLIQNPEQWIQNKGLNSVRVNIGDISQQNGTYSSSILGSVINSYRGSSNLTSVLGSLGNSSVPNIVQNNLCKDASLSNVAKNDVMKSDGTYDLEAYQNRKQDLFNSLCVGNPTVNIPLARKLEAVGKQRPDIAGTDSLLAVSFGDNEYNRSVKSQVAIAEDKARKEKAAEADLNRGGGIASATKCDQPATADGSDIANIPCRVESITNVGSALSNTFQEALVGDQKKLQNASGAGMWSSLSSILQVVASAFDLSNLSSGSGSQPSLNEIQDLDTPSKQTETAGTVQTPLQAHLTSLASLENTERSFLAELAGYQNSIQTIQVCYEKLKEDFNLESDPRVVSAFSFTSNKLAVIQSTQAESNKNLNSISTTRALINDTLASVAASKSTGEITTLFTNYQKKVEAQGLPSLSTASKRQADYTRFGGTVRQDNSSVGSIPRLTNECAQIRQSYQQNTQSSGGDGGAF